jgi:thiol-disulfide isomerase/thioredoxin
MRKLSSIAPLRRLDPRSLAFVASCGLGLQAPSIARDAPPPVAGEWRAWLVTKGGELPFELELATTADRIHATVTNGPERIAVPSATFAAAGGLLTLEFPHYDSRIEARVDGSGTRLDGTWRKRRGASEWQELAFHAAAGRARRFTDELLHAPEPGADRAQLAREFTAAVAVADGRHAIRFAGSDDPAVGLFSVAADGTATGTFLTTTGDYRFLAGQLDRGFAGDDGLVGCCDDGQPHHFLRLSCFDGAHAFLFSAEVHADGTLEGGFWSGDRWYERFTGRRDPAAALPDGFDLSRAEGAVALADLAFPQVFDPAAPSAPASFAARNLEDPALRGKVTLVQLFGSWCPNCHDASDELAALEREFGPRGLAILGLAFELTGDAARDAEQVRRYAARHAIRWPLLLAGSADKQAATASLGVLDRVRAYPTTLFVDAKGRIRHVFTGFSGPATGAAHTAQQAEFRRRIAELLEE